MCSQHTPYPFTYYQILGALLRGRLASSNRDIEGKSGIAKILVCQILQNSSGNSHQRDYQQKRNVGKGWRDLMPNCCPL